MMASDYQIAEVKPGSFAIQERVSGRWTTRPGRFKTPEAAQGELRRRLLAALDAVAVGLPTVGEGKAKRRPRGTGSLFQRSDGMWIGRVSFGYTADGHQDREEVSAATEAECEDKLVALQDKIRSGEHKRSPKYSITLKQYLLGWLEAEKENDAPGTYEAKHATVHNQIIPFLGARPLAKLTADDIDQWKRRMRDYKPEPIAVGVKLKPGQHRNPKPWSTRTREKAFVTLKDALGDALKRELVVRNVCGVVDAPESVSKTRADLTKDEAKLVLRKAEDAHDEWLSLWWFMVLTGQRSGECLGLTRDLVELNHVIKDDDGNDVTIGLADVSWQLQWLKYKPGKGHNDPDRHDVPEHWIVRPLWQRACLTRLKTDEPKIIPLPSPLRVALLAHYARVPESRYGLVWERTATMVRNQADVGLPIDDDRMLAALRKAINRTGIPDPANDRTMTWDAHSMRHTAGSLLQELKVPRDVRMSLMGHSTAAAHKAYMHKDLTGQIAAVNTLGAALS